MQSPCFFRLSIPLIREFGGDGLFLKAGATPVVFFAGGRLVAGSTGINIVWMSKPKPFTVAQNRSDKIEARKMLRCSVSEPFALM